MRRLAVLLRAVNVGGTAKLPMAGLRAMLADLGYDTPETLLASGNAIIGTAQAAAEVERRVAAALAQTFGLKTQVVVRDGAELAAVIKGDPFPDFSKAHPSWYMAMFLDGEPDAAGIAALAPYCTEGEEIGAGPRAVYLTYPNGAGRSKLSGGVIERKVGAKGTARNWNTVGKLAARLQGA